MDWRLFDPRPRLADLLGFKKVLSCLEADTCSCGWRLLPVASLGAALSLVLIGVAFALGRAQWPWANELFGIGLVTLYLPVALRVVREDVSRQERIGLVVMLGVAVYLVKVLQSPAAFIQFDEFLHVRTAIDILDKGHLFSVNSLLPVSPLYPGLEIATTAIANLTGLSIFWSGVLLLLVARIVFLLSLFLFIELVSGSARVAGIASLIYMAHSGFLFFHAMFAYESFATMFLALVLLLEAFTARSSRFLASLLCLTLPVFTALTATHHLTSAFATLLLMTVLLLLLICGSPVRQRLRAGAVAGGALFVFATWLFVIGNPVESYLAPLFGSGLSDFYKLLTGQNLGREVFVAEDGSGLPGWERIIVLAAVLLTCLGLAIGFFRTLAIKSANLSYPVDRSPLWSIGVGNNARAVLLTALTLGFPISVLLRLTKGGWEIGNRAGAFVFLGVGLVVAVGIVTFWLPNSKSWLRTFCVSAAMTMLFVGGAISGAGPRMVPGGYEVSNDALSIEPLGITAASWTKENLGVGWRFAADRINRILLATYGQQRVITTLKDRLDISSLVIGNELSDEDLNAIASGRVDYVTVDYRLSRARPAIGVYFEEGEDDQLHRAPPSSEALRKFNKLWGVGRTFDNGPISIYDVRSLHVH